MKVAAMASLVPDGPPVENNLEQSKATVERIASTLKALEPGQAMETRGEHQVLRDAAPETKVPAPPLKYDWSALAETKREIEVLTAFKRATTLDVSYPSDKILEYEKNKKAFGLETELDQFALHLYDPYNPGDRVFLEAVRPGIIGRLRGGLVQRYQQQAYTALQTFDGPITQEGLLFHYMKNKYPQMPETQPYTGGRTVPISWLEEAWAGGSTWVASAARQQLRFGDDYASVVTSLPGGWGIPRSGRTLGGRGVDSGRPTVTPRSPPVRGFVNPPEELGE